MVLLLPGLQGEVGVVVVVLEEAYSIPIALGGVDLSKRTRRTLDEVRIWRLGCLPSWRRGWT